PVGRGDLDGIAARTHHAAIGEEADMPTSELQHIGLRLRIDEGNEPRRLRAVLRFVDELRSAALLDAAIALDDEIAEDLRPVAVFLQLHPGKEKGAESPRGEIRLDRRHS